MSLRVLSLLAAALAGPMPAAMAAGVYVAGQGFTLEQAVEQAMRENAAEDGEGFWIVASGEAAHAVAGGEGAAALLERVRSRGGRIYVCERDLRRDQALPPGIGLVPVAAVSGGGVAAPDGDEKLPASETGYRLMLRACEALQ